LNVSVDSLKLDTKSWNNQ